MRGERESFKLLNYVADKIVRVALTTLARMSTCANCVCEGERLGEIEYVLLIKRNFLAKTWI